MENQRREIEVRWDGTCYVLSIGEARFAVDPDLVTVSTDGKSVIHNPLANSAAVYDENYEARIKHFPSYETLIVDLEGTQALQINRASGFVVALGNDERCLISGPAQEIKNIVVKSATDPTLSPQERRTAEQLRQQAATDGIAKLFYPPRRGSTIDYQLSNLKELVETGRALIEEIAHLKEPNRFQSRWNELARRAAQNRPFERESYERGAQVVIADGHIRILEPREPSEKRAWNERTFNDLTVNGIYRRLSEATGEEISDEERLRLAKDLYERFYVMCGDEISPPDGRSWKDVGLIYLRSIFYREEGGKRAPREVVERARQVVEELQPIYEELLAQQFAADDERLKEETGYSYVVEQAATLPEDSFNPLGNYFDQQWLKTWENEEKEPEHEIDEIDDEKRSLNLEEAIFTPAEFEHYQVIDADRYAIFPGLKLDEEDQDLDEYLKEIRTYEKLLANDPFLQLETTIYIKQYIGEVWGYAKAPRTVGTKASVNEQQERLSSVITHSLQTPFPPERLGVDARETQLEALVAGALIARQLSHEAERRGDLAQLHGAGLMAYNLLGKAQARFNTQELRAQLERTLALNPELQRIAQAWPALRTYIGDAHRKEDRLDNLRFGVSCSLGGQSDSRLTCRTLLAATLARQELEAARLQVAHLRSLTQSIASALYAQTQEQTQEKAQFWTEAARALEQIALKEGLPPSFIKYIRSRVPAEGLIPLPNLDDQERAQILAALNKEQKRVDRNDLLRICERLSVNAPLVPIDFRYDLKLFATNGKQVIKLEPPTESVVRPAKALFDAFRKWMSKNDLEKLTELKPEERRRAFELAASPQRDMIYRFLHNKGFAGHVTKEQLWQFYRERQTAIEKENAHARQRLQNDPRYRELREAIEQAAKLPGDVAEKRIKYIAGMVGGYIKPNNQNDQQLLRNYETLCRDIPQAKKEVYNLVQEAKATSDRMRAANARASAPLRQPEPDGAKIDNHPFIKLFNGLACVETLRLSNPDDVAQIANRAAIAIKSESVRKAIADILDGGTQVDRQLATALRSAAPGEIDHSIQIPKASLEGERAAIERMTSLIANPDRLRLNEPAQAFIARARLAEALAHVNTRLEQLAHAKEDSPVYRVNRDKLGEALKDTALAYDNLKRARSEPATEADAPTWLYAQIFNDGAPSTIIQNPIFKEVANNAKQVYERNCAYHLAALLEETIRNGSFKRAKQIHELKGNGETAKEFETLEKIVKGELPAPMRTDMVLTEEARSAYMVSSIGQSCRALLPNDWSHVNLNEAVLDRYANNYIQRALGGQPLPSERAVQTVEVIKEEIIAKNELCAQVASVETLLVTAYTQRDDKELRSKILEELRKALQRTAQHVNESNRLAGARATAIEQLRQTTQSRQQEQRTTEVSVNQMPAR